MKCRLVYGGRGAMRAGGTVAEGPERGGVKHKGQN